MTNCPKLDVIIIVFVCPMQCMALDRYKINGVSVCLSVCPEYLSSSIATAVFVRSSSNLECRSPMWERRVSSMANNTGSSKCARASIYFRFSSLLGCVHALPFLMRFYQSWYVDSFCQEKEQAHSVTQPEGIYAHARNLTSGFFTNLLTMPLNVRLQAKFRV